MKPQCADILRVLSDGNPHSAMEFKTGWWGFHVDAVSQRIGDLRRLGHPIVNCKRDGGQAVYRLERS